MRFAIIFLFLFTVKFVTAQTSGLHFSKYSVGESTVQVYLPTPPGDASINYSDDSSKFTTIESLDSSTGDYYHFGALVVNLKKAIDAGEQEKLLTTNFDNMKQTVNVVSSAGYSTGLSLITHESAIGIEDLWVGKDGYKWSVTGWITENTLVVLFEYGLNEYPDRNSLAIFKNGVRFYGD